MAQRAPLAPSFSCDVETVHGSLAGPIERYKRLIMAGAMVLLLIYVATLIVLLPQDCWSIDTGTSRRGTFAVVALILLPIIGVSTGLVAWARSTKGKRIPGSRLHLFEGKLTLELGDGRCRELVIDRSAKVRLGSWIVSQVRAGPLIRVETNAGSISIAAQSPPLALEGIEGSADVMLDIDDVREFSRTLGLGPIE